MTEIPDIEILGFLLTDSARHLRTAFEKRISEAGLGITPAEARTLLNVHALKDCRQLDIAARMGIEPMTVCTFLDKLQAQDLIERHPDPVDRRAKRVRLTTSSMPMIEAIRTELRALLAQATKGMDDGDAETLCRLLSHVSRNLQADEPMPEATA